MMKLWKTSPMRARDEVRVVVRQQALPIVFDEVPNAASVVVDPAGHVLGLVQQPRHRFLVRILDRRPVVAALLRRFNNMPLQRLIAGKLVSLSFRSLRLGGSALGGDCLLQTWHQRLFHSGDDLGPRQVAERDARVRPLGDAIEVDGNAHWQVERLALQEFAHDALDRRLVVEAGAHLAQHGHGHGHFDDVVEVAVGRHLGNDKHLTVGLGSGQRLFQVGVDLGIGDVFQPGQARRKRRHALGVERLAPVRHHLAHALEAHQAHRGSLAFGQIQLLQDRDVFAAVLDLV
jgi:hypothetical protein